MLHNRLRLVFWTASLAVCAGCAGTAPNPTASAGSSAVSATRFQLPARPGLPALRAGGWMSPAAKHAKQLIYVSDFINNDVEIYSTTGSNPVGEITSGIDGPEGLFVDKHHNLYVTNATNATVTMYPHGKSSPKLTYTGFAYPTVVTVGKNGMVYVGDLVGEKVVEFPKGSTRSKLTIDISYPQGVALDSSNNLYIEYNTGAHGAGPGTVDEFAPGSTNGTNLNLPIVWAAGDAIDSKNDVVTADQGSGSNAAIYVFPPGSTSPSQTITQGMEDPFRIAFDNKFTTLYVADPEVNGVLVYDYATGALTKTMATGLGSVDGVALSSEGN